MTSPGFSQGFLGFMPFENVCPKSEPLHEAVGGSDGRDRCHIELEIDGNGIPEKVERLGIRKVHAPPAAEILPFIKVIT